MIPSFGDFLGLIFENGNSTKNTQSPDNSRDTKATTLCSSWFFVFFVLQT
jgi:hypothetical protein